jgi:hypothetical protein
MKEFQDENGHPWVATVEEREGPDYKGRFFLVLRPSDNASGEQVELLDIRWNSERSAGRTLETMSGVELRRRLRSALGRAGGPGLP